MIVIVESETANLMSVTVACERLGLEPVLSRDPEVIAKASHVLLPGVGHAQAGMRGLGHLLPVLRDLQKPLLGICLGMQLLYESSEEGPTQGFGFLPGAVHAIPPAPQLSLPHMGWNKLVIAKDHPLFVGLPAESYFYFVHSYQAPMDASVLAHVEHGTSIPAVVARGLYYGVQFHPEKSGAAGQRLLRNFFTL